MTNAGNAVHTVYIASLPPGPVWLLHCMYSGVAVFMLAAHRRWARPSSTAGSRLESLGANRLRPHDSPEGLDPASPSPFDCD